MFQTVHLFNEFLMLSVSNQVSPPGLQPNSEPDVSNYWAKA